MRACEKHSKNPVLGYSPCPGCEIETLKIKLAASDFACKELTGEKNELLSEVDRLQAEIKRLEVRASLFMDSSGKASKASMVHLLSRWRSEKESEESDFIATEACMENVKLRKECNNLLISNKKILDALILCSQDTCADPLEQQDRTILECRIWKKDQFFCAACTAKVALEEMKNESAD
jgi:predicted nuclease with TOPRIM domain